MQFLFKKKTIFIIKKSSELYLMQIQISFVTLEKFRSILNENTDQFLLEKISNLYLVKIQICFCLEIFSEKFQKNTDLYFLKIF